MFARDNIFHMIRSLQTPLGRVRWLGNVEGISFLLLLGLAMPLKYWADMPRAVSIVGMVHGILFICFCLVLLLAWLGGKLSARWAFIAFVATLLPFGPFIIDKKLAEFEQN